MTKFVRSDKMLRGGGGIVGVGVAVVGDLADLHPVEEVAQRVGRGRDRIVN